MARPLKLNAASALTLRGHTYWFVKAVPKALKPSVAKSRWRFSLGTTDRSVALERAQAFLDEVRERLLDQHDPSSAYFRELSNLRGVSATDADHIMDSLDPELNEDEAPAFFAARQVAQGVAPPPELFTFRSVALDYYKRRPNKQRTTDVAINRWNLADQAVSTLTRKEVGDKLDLRLEEASVATVQHNLSDLNLLYRHAERLGIIDFQPITVFQKWQLRKTERNRTAPMPNDLYRTLYESLGDDRWVMVVSRLSGLRPSEASQCRLETIDGVKCLITTHSKTAAGRDRVVPVHSSLIDSIETIMPYLTTIHAKRAQNRLTKWKVRKREPYCNFGRDTNMYSCRVSALTDMASAPEELRMAIAGHRSVHGGYIDRYDIKQLVECIELIRDPLARGNAL